MGTFQQSRVLQRGLEKFRDGVTKTQNLHVQDEQGDFGSILFPARLWFPEQGQEWVQQESSKGIWDSCGVPWQQGKAGCSGAELRGFLRWLWVLQEASLPTQPKTLQMLLVL